MKAVFSFLLLASPLLGGCATGPNPNAMNAAVGERIADMPHWMGGLPPGVPPRRGTAAYDEWQAKRALEAARPKSKDEPSKDVPVDAQ
jgi:hypothetical protein